MPSLPPPLASLPSPPFVVFVLVVFVFVAFVFIVVVFDTFVVVVFVVVVDIVFKPSSAPALSSLPTCLTTTLAPAQSAPTPETQKPFNNQEPLVQKKKRKKSTHLKGRSMPRVTDVTFLDQGIIPGSLSGT